MTLGLQGMDWNTARYIQSIQSMDGLSTGSVNSLFNTSIFGNNGLGYSTMPFAGYGMNLNQMMNYQQQYTDANLQMNKKNKAANLLATADENSIARQVAALQRQVQENKQENVMQEYNKLLASVRQTYEEAGYNDVSDAQIKATAEKMYADSTGNALINDIKAHSDNSFVHGFKKVLSLGIAGGQSRNKNIQEITGENANNALSVSGEIAGGVTAGLTLATAAKGLNVFAKSSVGKALGKAIITFIKK